VTTEPDDTTSEPAATPQPTRKEFVFSSALGSDFQPELHTVGELIEYAETQGFTHTERFIAGDGTCGRTFTDDYKKAPIHLLLARPAVESGINVLVKSLICEYGILGGRRLNPGWQWKQLIIVDEHASGDGEWQGTFAITKQPPADSLNFRFQITVPAYSCGIGAPRLICPPPSGFDTDIFGGQWVQAGGIGELVIEGPAEATDWRDAFTQ
jgi:hypothetical protein